MLRHMDLTGFSVISNRAGIVQQIYTIAEIAKALFLWVVGQCMSAGIAALISPHPVGLAL